MTYHEEFFHPHPRGERRFRSRDDVPTDGPERHSRGHRGRGGRPGAMHSPVPEGMREALADAMANEFPGGPGLRGPRGGRGGGRAGQGFGRPGGWQQADLPAADDAADWFAGRLPQDWFVTAATVSVDREEITVVGELPPMEGDQTHSEAATTGRISRFREQTREARVQIADEAQARYGRKIAWGASLGGTTVLFTHLSVPVMTRLRQPERQVLDTLVDAGVARSRSEALAWSVRLVGEHTEEWLSNLREAMAEVNKLRSEGPSL